MMTTDLRPERARHLWKRGESSVDIAAELGATTAQVNDWLGPAVTTITADPEPAPSTATADELAAMHVVVAALEKLGPNARHRVTNWAHAHLENRVIPWSPVPAMLQPQIPATPYIYSGVSSATPPPQFAQSSGT